MSANHKDIKNSETSRATQNTTKITKASRATRKNTKSSEALSATQKDTKGTVALTTTQENIKKIGASKAIHKTTKASSNFRTVLKHNQKLFRLCFQTDKKYFIILILNELRNSGIVFLEFTLGRSLVL
ncbi:MAG: hypothetical protein LBM69_06505, partial [Lachnospiraceae bacterium]|nr:hypothetical protein [Lachnospiraceae bacterium]